MHAAEYYREYRAKKEGKPLYMKSDFIPCLICKEQFVFVGAHVWQKHRLYMFEYKKQFGLDTKRGRTAGQFRELKRNTNKGVKNLEAGKVYRLRKGEAIYYKRSAETLDRLSNQAKKIGKIYGGRNAKPKGGESI